MINSVVIVCFGSFQFCKHMLNCLMNNMGTSIFNLYQSILRMQHDEAVESDERGESTFMWKCSQQQHQQRHEELNQQAIGDG